MSPIQTSCSYGGAAQLSRGHGKSAQRASAICDTSHPGVPHSSLRWPHRQVLPYKEERGRQRWGQEKFQIWSQRQETRLWQRRRRQCQQHKRQWQERWQSKKQQWRWLQSDGAMNTQLQVRPSSVALAGTLLPKIGLSTLHASQPHCRHQTLLPRDRGNRRQGRSHGTSGETKGMGRAHPSKGTNSCRQTTCTKGNTYSLLQLYPLPLNNHFPVLTCNSLNPSPFQVFLVRSHYFISNSFIL